MDTKYCPHCKQNLPVGSFGVNSGSKDGRQVYCRDCRKKYDKKNYQASPKARQRVAFYLRKRRAKIVLFLQRYCETHPCVICGESDFVVLDFDHLGNKTESISKMVRDGSDLDEIKAELKKCQVLCSNCHRRKTAKQFGYYQFIEKLPEEVVSKIKLELEADGYS